MTVSELGVGRLSGFLTPLAGKTADRFDLRPVMIVSDVASLAIWAVLV